LQWVGRGDQIKLLTLALNSALPLLLHSLVKPHDEKVDTYAFRSYFVGINPFLEWPFFLQRYSTPFSKIGKTENKS